MHELGSLKLTFNLVVEAKFCNSSASVEGPQGLLDSQSRGSNELQAQWETLLSQKMSN